MDYWVVYEGKETKKYGKPFVYVDLKKSSIGIIIDKVGHLEGINTVLLNGKISDVREKTITEDVISYVHLAKFFEYYDGNSKKLDELTSNRKGLLELKFYLEDQEENSIPSIEKLKSAPNFKKVLRRIKKETNLDPRLIEIAGLESLLSK